MTPAATWIWLRLDLVKNEAVVSLQAGHSAFSGGSGLNRLVGDEVAVQQVADLKDLLGTGCGELQLLRQDR